MTANLAHRRPDAYGPQHPWRTMKPTDREIRDYLGRIRTLGAMAASLTPDKVDDPIAEADRLLSQQPAYIRAVRAVAEALPQHREAAAQAVFQGLQ